MQSEFLRRVIERTIHPVYVAQQYTTFYVREQLDCGHIHAAFAGDPLIAQKRVCQECAQSLQATPALPPKKPVQSARFPDERKRRAG